MRRHQDTGLVVRLGRSRPSSFDKPVISAAESRTIALDFITGHPISLGTLANSSIEILNVVTNQYEPNLFPDRKASFIVTYRAIANGYPFYGAVSKITMNHAGEIYSVRHFVPDGARIPAAPLLSKTQILERLAQEYRVEELNLIEQPKLYAMSPDKLVWKVRIERPLDVDILIDAISGAIIESKRNLYEQAPTDQFWLHGEIQGSGDGVAALGPLEDATVVIMNQNPLWSDEELWRGQTDASGLYNVAPPTYLDVWDSPSGTDPVDAFVRVELECDQVRSERFDNILDSDLITLSSDVFQPTSTGDYTENLLFNTGMELEGSCAFNEIRRGWRTSWGHPRKQN
ncbi:hypothetical protein KKA85_10265 [bacterium]|nr:hypothetical protein [bacterium]MBU1676150.1 hypothetical protein [bacterium]